MEIDPASETLYTLEYGMIDKIKNSVILIAVEDFQNFSFSVWNQANRSLLSPKRPICRNLRLPLLDWLSHKFTFVTFERYLVRILPGHRLSWLSICVPAGKCRNNVSIRLRFHLCNYACSVTLALVACVGATVCKRRGMRKMGAQGVDAR
jgi:hypothetical protein